MKVILFGATGMVGQGVLRECLLDAGVEACLRSGAARPAPARQAARNPAQRFHGLFRNRAELTGYDACFFCLGVSSVGMEAERYRHLTYDITMAAAKTL